MQGKIAHAAERKAFSVAIDNVINAMNGGDRERALANFINIADRLMKSTAPGVTKGLRENLTPGSKWEKFLFSVIDESDKKVLKTVVLNGGYEAGFRGLRTTTENAAKYDCNVPWIVLFDPTSACNKHCIGCWAAEYGHQFNLTYDEMDSLVSQAEALGTHLFMMTGGEPLVRKKDVLRLAKEHNESLFNIFTNASLIDDAFCDDVVDAANIVFSISLEGTEDTNDARRGDGSYCEAIAAMRRLREHGLLFGTSTAYTRANIETVTSDEYMQTLVDNGVRWAWFFHFMPVGKGASADLMPTPDQRVYIIKRFAELRADDRYPLFLMDFQDDGWATHGCVAGGRAYCHVNAAGYVEPCVFIHYSSANIKEESWLDCLQQPLFQRYKRMDWTDNMYRPCPMLENPENLPKMVADAGAKNTDYTAQETPEELESKVKPYADAWYPVAERLWKEKYPNGYRTDNIGKTSDMNVRDKAKILEQEDKMPVA